MANWWKVLSQTEITETHERVVSILVAVLSMILAVLTLFGVAQGNVANWVGVLVALAGLMSILVSLERMFHNVHIAAFIVLSGLFFLVAVIGAVGLMIH
ncbi:hypothetical protein [Paracoccus thiocyanatus]|uniref:Uncharacterized protein n=1 Tax=Paracoccus thiocyanatus TaxID=34006 RepID=A0A3D8PCH1_9RHOB|nr:hypothetical protein [Paracoccus thiocyanatus]RDW12961.1 hypothetical protein DIE28_10830 [Paracoccus thiocyanatus]